MSILTRADQTYKWRSHYFLEVGAAEEAIELARELRTRGYTRLEAFTPYSIPELDEAIGIARTTIPRFAFLAGLSGSLIAYAILSWTAAVDYPIMVGGRPYNSLPAHIPIVFETTVLLTGLTCFFLSLLLSRLPALYHPVFEIEGFDRTTRDRFWIGIDDGDPKLDHAVGDELIAAGTFGVLAVHRAETAVPIAHLEKSS